jgi:bacteriorhodopsin
LMEDVINIFIKPTSAFENNRNASFVKPALVQMVILTALAFALNNLISPYLDADFQRGVTLAAQKGTPMPAQAVAMGAKFAGYSLFAIGILGPWLTAIFGGLFTWIGARIVGAKLTYGQSATVASWSAFPSILAFITMGILGVLADPTTVRGVTDAQLGPGRFVDPMTTPPVLLTLLQSLDLFSIWTVVLLGIGVAVVARVSTGTGMIASVIKWALVALFTVGAAALR